MEACADDSPILFLDFDGVISIDIEGVDATERIIPERIKYLNKIIEATGAKVVVSSTWRYDPSTQLGFKPDKLTSWLKVMGFVGEIYDITPVLPGDGVRGFEIQAWMDAQPSPPKSIAILEDWEYMAHLTPWTIKIDGESGLKESDADRAIRLLQSEGVWSRKAG